MFLSLFWASVFIVLFTYFGFPLILAVRAVVRGKKNRISVPHPSSESLPRISMLIAAYNEQESIICKLENTFSLSYPAERLEVIVASDGSTDGTNELVSSFNEARLRHLVLPRQGKNRTLNAAASISHGEILVFTDADALLKQDALVHLIVPFQDSTVGGVAGDYRYSDSTKNTNQEKTYWKYDRILKHLQSSQGDVTSATGQIYAIRRSLFQPIPEKLTDDFFVSVQAPASFQRLVFEPRAVAFGPAGDAGRPEFERKVRVITGGLRTVWRVRHLLNPIRYGFYAFQLFTHKVLRRLLVIPLLLMLISSTALWHHSWIYQSAFLSQVLLHSLAILGYLFRNRSIGRSKAFSLPYFYDLVNVACLVAFLNLWRGSRHDIWKPARTPAAAMETPE